MNEDFTTIRYHDDADAPIRVQAPIMRAMNWELAAGTEMKIILALVHSYEESKDVWLAIGLEGADTAIVKAPDPKRFKDLDKRKTFTLGVIDRDK